MQSLDETTLAEHYELHLDLWKTLKRHGLTMANPEQVLDLFAQSAGLVIGVSCAPKARDKVAKEFARATRKQMKKFPLKVTDI